MLDLVNISYREIFCRNYSTPELCDLRLLYMYKYVCFSCLTGFLNTTKMLNKHKNKCPLLLQTLLINLLMFLCILLFKINSFYFMWNVSRTTLLMLACFTLNNCRYFVMSFLLFTKVMEIWWEKKDILELKECVCTLTLDI